MTDNFDETYMHIWHHKDGTYNVAEQALTRGLRKAISAYNEQLDTLGKYHHSLVLQSGCMTWTIFNMENHLAKLKEENDEEKERRRRDDDKYGSYDKQVHDTYNSSRGV